MAFDKLIETLRNEIEKEMELREEIIYKKGFAAGTEEVSNCQCEDCFMENYAEGIFDAFDGFKELVEMTGKERINRFGTTSLIEILDAYEPLEILNELSREETPEEQPEDEICKIIGAILDLDISDDIKKYVLGDIIISDIIK